MFIKEKIKRVILKRKFADCIIEKGVTIDKLSNLQGNNVIGKNTFIIQSNIGEYSYIRENCYFCKTRIGRYSSIAGNVRGIYGMHPVGRNVSTSPVFYLKDGNGVCSKVSKDKIALEEKYPFAGDDIYIDIGNDVWIGEDVRIMGGIKVGDGAVIGAGALVAKDVPPYAIVGGVPAKIIRYRFTDEQIKWLLELKWWDKNEKWISENLDVFFDIEKLKERIQNNDNN